MPVWSIAIGFLLFFAALWLLVTTVLHNLSGWAKLQRAFPYEPAHVLESMRFVSGAMGYLPLGGVQYGQCLSLDVCRTGLRVRVWRIFGIVSRPFLVPWRDITVTPRRVLFFPCYRLGFGDPEVGQLTLSPWAVRRIERAAKGSFAVPGS
ncbi:hypothetical protein OZN62_00655 [Aurantiacibacter sp. MUD11]|uniref:hypothetical protein n=1 Tax=Aurantiacibacter sp. MUD11 TaxID=3003265 RepID=UPI0022AB484C|nr:hypothetical protein [Aurantiacibacter sp. MUD11]WAT18120.1 hypothetical protein OZN62_00655 [Aurantiacibacter sp. MUD11]